MKFIVIGLGYYGKSVAVRLTEAGHEVICVDNRMSNIESIKDNVSAAFAFDASDMNALSSIPVKEAEIRSKFGLTPIAIFKSERSVNDVGISAVHPVIENGLSEDTILQQGDILLCYGTEKDFFKFASK